MKILFSSQIREADAYTIKNLPITSVDLMEKAAGQLFEWISSRYSNKSKFIIFCGPGNNGGDGLALARMLVEKRYKLDIIIINSQSELKGDSLINYKRLLDQNKVEVNFIENKKNLPHIDKDYIIIDALFGTGLTRPLDGNIAEIVNYLNQSASDIISIDIPSGLFGENNADNNMDNVIKAKYTLSFQFPKLSFFLPQSGVKTGEWFLLPIGLHPEFISSVAVNHYYIKKEYISSLIKHRNKFDHKGFFGHSLLIAGSYGMMGAAVLASKACIRSGSGLLSTHVPVSGYQIMQISLPEAIVSVDTSKTVFSEIPELSPYNAVGIGPGIGKHENSLKALSSLFDKLNVPLVIDADGLNLIGENKYLLEKLPEKTIITPHLKEFERLAGKTKDDYSRNQLQSEFSKKYKLIVVLKGAYTAITDIDGSTYFNTSGNPGMATAGSGDVLTGIILALLSQGYKPLFSSFIGVFLHGLAGDIAVENSSEESLTASDIISKLGAAWKYLK